MDPSKSFRIIVGILLLISSLTIFALLFIEPEALAVIFNFSIGITTENLAEAISGAVVGLMATLAFFIAMFIVGIFNLIIYVLFGSLTLGLKKSKTMQILTLILTSFALFLEIRAIIFLTIGGLNSIILILRVISDIVIVALTIYLFRQIYKEKEATPKS